MFERKGLPSDLDLLPTLKNRFNPQRVMLTFMTDKIIIVCSTAGLMHFTFFDVGLA